MSVAPSPIITTLLKQTKHSATKDAQECIANAAHTHRAVNAYSIVHALYIHIVLLLQFLHHTSLSSRLTGGLRFIKTRVLSCLEQKSNKV